MHSSMNPLILLSLTASVALSREFVPCNPLKDADCLGINKALSASITEDFTKPSSQFTIFSERGRTEYLDKGLKLTIEKRFDNPSIRSNFYIHFGRVEFVCRAAKGQGIVSSVFLQSDDLDEIDIEWIGGSLDSVQTNYFAKGDTSDYSRGQFHSVDNILESHNYTMDWTNTSLTFYIDGEVVRTVYNDESTADYGYPQTPMAVLIGIWVGGDTENSPGTIQWAGGLADFNTGPFSMEVEMLKVEDYSSGAVYRYADRSGTWASITSGNDWSGGHWGEKERRFVQFSGEYGNILESEGSREVKRSCWFVFWALLALWW